MRPMLTSVEPGPRSPASRQGGFTLIELMITVVIMAILLTIAVPAFGRLVASNRLSSQANELVLALNLTRSEAVRRGQPVTIRTTDATAPVFSSGWRMFTDANADGVAASTPTTADGSVLREGQAVAGSTTVTRVTRSGSSGSYVYATATSSVADRMFVTFNAFGANNSGSAAFFRVCDSSYPALPGRIIQVSVVGRVFVDSSNATCS